MTNAEAEAKIAEAVAAAYEDAARIAEAPAIEHRAAQAKYAEDGDAVCGQGQFCEDFGCSTLTGIAAAIRARGSAPASVSIADRIRALPFTPDTHTGTRQAWMRENAARLVEGLEPLPWAPSPETSYVPHVPPAPAPETPRGGECPNCQSCPFCGLALFYQAESRSGICTGCARDHAQAPPAEPEESR